jgi:hypothetical protein
MTVRRQGYPVASAIPNVICYSGEQWVTGPTLAPTVLLAADDKGNDSCGLSVGTAHGATAVWGDPAR